MRIAAQKINSNGVVISKSKVEAVTRRYTKQYGQACESLYAMGYLSTPTYFYDDEFWSTFFECFSEYITRFLNTHTGAMVYTIEQIDYVLIVLRHDNNTDAYNALSLASKALRARQAIYDLGKLCSSVKFYKKSDLVTCKSSIAVSSRVFNSNKVPLDSPYVQECFYFGDKEVVKLNYSVVIYKELLKALGVSCEESAFLGGSFTAEDDCRFLSQIINGEIVGEGKYYKLLRKTVDSYYEDYYRTRTTLAECIGYVEKNFVSAIPACIEFINNFRKTLPSGYREVYVNSTEVWFQLDTPKTSVESTVHDRFIGEFLYDYEKREPLGVVNQLLGFSGEFINESSPNISSYNISGMPVDMDGSRYYHILSSKNNIYPKVDFSGKKYLSVQEVLGVLEVVSLDTLDIEISDLLTTDYCSHTEKYRRLVGKLVQSLVCMLCDYTLDGHSSPNHVVLDSDFDWVTDADYLNACKESGYLFQNLGF